MRLADANIFLRHLVKPTTDLDRIKSEACRALFERLRDGSEEATTTEAVLAEVIFVLVSPRQYGLAPAEITARLKPLIALPGLKIPRKRLYLRALDLFSSHTRLDFEDALSAAIVERFDPPELYSYDTDFDRIPGVTRIEPLHPSNQVPQSGNDLDSTT
jgi:predicted nucleic acid-binding protein